MPAYMVGMSNIHAARKYGKRWRKKTAINQSGDDAAPASATGAKYSVRPGTLECGDEGLPAAAVPRRQPEPSRARVLPQNLSPRTLSSRVLTFDSPSDVEATVVVTDLVANMALRRGSAALKVP